MSELYPLITLPMSDGWNVSTPQDYRSLVENAKSIQQLILFCQQKHITAGFRREVSVDGFPILCAILPAKKTILVGSRRLSRELALLSAAELDKTSESLQALKLHVETMSTLDPRQFPTEWEWVTWENNLPDWSQLTEWQDVEELTGEKLRQLVKHVQQYQPTLFERVSDWGLGLTAQFALIRIHLLKFLAVLPSLDHDKSGNEVKRNLTESLRRLQDDHDRLKSRGIKHGGSRPLPHAYAVSLGMALQVVRFLPAGLLAMIVRGMVKKMAKRFIAGESISSSHKTLQNLHDSRREATLDQLGELVVSEEEADEYVKRVLAIVHGLKIHVQPGEKNGAGIPKAHVSIKVSAMCSDFKPQAYQATYDLVAPRLKRVLIEASREQVFVNIDAEHYHYRDLVFRIYSQILLETPELKGWAQTGIVLQAYLRDASTHLSEIIDLARERGVRMPIRLVKGAYWDAETIEAEVHSHHAPQFLNKEESDLHFRQLAAMALMHPDEIHLAVGSHNLQDHCFVEALRQLRFDQAPVVEHQCLHMTYEALSHGLSKMGWPTRNYMPIGNLLVGMAYLVRRIMENSSQVGVLTIMRSHNKKDAFIAPILIHHQKRDLGQLQRDDLEGRLDSGFRNCTPARLYVEEECQRFQAALEKLEKELMVKQGEFKAQAGQKVLCSSRPSMIVGVAPISTAQETDNAINEISSGFAHQHSWSGYSLTQRLAPLMRAADKMWLQRDELAALIVLEAGKAWGEALADVDEAIDFISFYCREEIRLMRLDPRRVARGPAAVIAPWNFPLAIPCGMTVAPLVAGNPVILKPAEQTPLIAQKMMELFWDAGIPRDSLKVIYGEGEVVGAPLVRHPSIASIVFTGSKGVGQWIYRTAAGQFFKHPRTGLSYPKKVITEMGGKNAIIVTNNCEQDETVSGILYAAFGHAGQKCSACSRVLVDAEVKDALMVRLVKAVEDLEVGPATDPRVMVNPLITSDDQTRVRNAVKEARAEAELNGGKVWVDRSTETHEGYVVGPAVIELPAARARLADSWAQREIFGPVIHVVPFTNLSEAIEIFNGTEYGLTGGVYGQSQDDIDHLMSQLKCGNLYVNRPNTGARVAIEPFGGFKLSGTGPKAGGRDYLSSFHVIPLKDDKGVTEAWGKGSGYQYVTPRPSQLSLAGRLVRVQRFGQSLMERFEVVMHRVGENEKRLMSDYLTWLNTQSAGYLQGQHTNLRIPGQLSFDQKDQTREVAMLVLGERVPSTAAMFHLFSALAASTGVSLVCTNSEAYNVWKQVVDMAWQAGLSKQNIEIYQMSADELQSALRDPQISLVYASGDEAFAKKVFGMALDMDGLKSHMRALCSDAERPDFADSAAWFDQYLWTRSFAINTMRHGAPLELGL